MKAYDIALRDLRACYGEHGIFAGLNHFRDYWARDALFASLGSLAAGDVDQVKTVIQVFLDNFDRKAQVPLRIGRTIPEIVLNRKRRRPLYNFDFNKRKPADQNSLLIIAAYEYLKHTKDTAFIKKNIRKLERVMQWNFLNDTDDDLLIEELGLSSWADSIHKKGKVLYTNVCHCHALKCMFELTKKKEYLEKHKNVKKILNEKFWSGEHYIDWIDFSGKQYNYFATDGNALAVIWEIAEEKRAANIEEAAHIFELHDVPSECVHPAYPKKHVSLPLKLIGLGDYHNGLSWLWLGCISAIAQHKAGKKDNAEKLMKKIGKVIEKHGSVYEVYDKKAMPVKRLFYRAEHPFAWSAGLFIYAQSIIYS